MHEQGSIAVIGAGVVGCAVAYALSREGRRVVLIDRQEPGIAGASYGNAGHIAAELVEPLPSVKLLFGFWRELFVCGGALDIPLRRVPAFLPWAARFAAAAFKRGTNTAHLAPLVRSAPAVLEQWLREMRRTELLRRHGHYEVWLNKGGEERAGAQARAMDRIEVRTAAAPDELLQRVRAATGASAASGLWFPDSAHVIDPLQLVQALAAAAAGRGAQIRRAEISGLRPCAAGVEIIADAQSTLVDGAVVCAGAWSAPLLTPLGLSVPLESIRGYHIELPQRTPLVDAPLVYSNEQVIVTPMRERLRASSYMEFLEPGAPADARKPARLRERLRALGYDCETQGPSWVGARSALPDYLPGIGRAQDTKILYAIGHQHIGLTTAVTTAELIADLIAERDPRYGIAAFDLRRFGLSGRPARRSEAARTMR